MNNGLDTNRYEIRVSTSNMFAHLDCLESRRPKTPGARSVAPPASPSGAESFGRKRSK